MPSINDCDHNDAKTDIKETIERLEMFMILCNQKIAKMQLDINNEIKHLNYSNLNQLYASLAEWVICAIETRVFINEATNRILISEPTHKNINI